MLTTEQINRITIEVGLGIDPAEPDSDEAAEFRAKVKPEIDQIREDGKEIRIPNE
jgi:hypothetical protein